MKLLRNTVKLKLKLKENNQLLKEYDSLTLLNTSFCYVFSYHKIRRKKVWMS